jgi:hypothetical protein
MLLHTLIRKKLWRDIARLFSALRPDVSTLRRNQARPATPALKDDPSSHSTAGSDGHDDITGNLLRRDRIGADGWS